MNDKPKYRRVADDISGRIESGEFSPDERLPAIRTLADAIGVNITTVVRAYKYLEQQGIVYSLVGSGTYVAGSSGGVSESVQSAFSSEFINFADTSTDPEYFPKEDFRRAFDAVLERDGSAAFRPPSNPGLGYGPLRDIFREYLPFDCDADNIRVISNLRQGISIVSKALLSPGDRVLVECPTAQGAETIFTSLGARIIRLPLEVTGPDLDKLERLVRKHKPKLFFLMPTYQIPTGLCYTNDAKTGILRLAGEYGIYVIEADSFGDFYYGQRPVPMKAMDSHSIVFYIKSFDRVLAPDLAGCLIGSAACPLGETIGVPGYIQRGLDYYLRHGGFKEHSDRMRVRYGKRYARAVAAVDTFLAPFASYIKPEGGLSLYLRPNSAKISIDRFGEALLKRKVLVSPGGLFTPVGGKESCFRISFANVNEDKISEGIGIIAQEFSQGGA